MSATSNTDDVQGMLPDVATAEQLIMERVHKRAFLEKVAQLSPAFLPQTHEDLEDMVAMGRELQNAAAVEDHQVKTASVSPFAVARAALEQTLGEAGMDGHLKQAAHVQHVDRLRNIGAALLQDPDLYDAALAIKIAQAQSLEQANG